MMPVDAQVHQFVRSSEDGDDRLALHWYGMRRLHQTIFIVSVVLSSWLGMQDVHELGHVCAAWLTGGTVAQVVLHPLTISRTDVAENPAPLIVVWAGPVLGCLLPLAVWGVVTALRWPWAYLPRFFAGFCLIANGAYIGVGSFDRVGDAGVMLRHDSPAWWLWAFGAVTVPAGLWLWHRQGSHFGLGAAGGMVNARTTYACLGMLAALVVLGLAVDGE
jgi:Peptidase M50B-like